MDPGGCGWGCPAAKAAHGEARSAYFPASSVGETTAVMAQTTDQSLQARGHFCVVMTPQDALQTGRQRTIATWTQPCSPKIDGTRTPQMRGELNTMKRSGGTRSTTGSSNFQKPFQIVTQTTARQERVQEGSRRRPATAPGELHQMDRACRRLPGGRAAAGGQ